MKNNVSNTINNVIDESVSADEGSISMNNEVHDGFEPESEGVTKAVDLCNVSLHYEDIISKLEYLYQMGITF